MKRSVSCCTNAFSIEPVERRLLLSGVVASPIAIETDPTGVSSYLLSLASSNTIDPKLIYDDSGRVGIRVTAIDVNVLEAPLAAMGFVKVAAVPADHLVEGFIPYSALANINALSGDGLLGVLPNYKPMTYAGKVDSEADSILEADRTRAATGNSGSGVTVGVLSDSYALTNTVTPAMDVASGDLPSNVNVLQDSTTAIGGDDEGRAMLQIVHDIAPGASLAFATAGISEAGFAQNIQNLANPVSSKGAGANIIVDDEGYFDEPFFQDGIVAQAVNNVVTNNGVSYFSAAGNVDNQSYESTNVNFVTDTISAISTTARSYYNFNPTGTANDKQSVTLARYAGITLGLQWDQPFYTTTGVTSNISMYLVNTSTNKVVKSAVYNNIAGQEPFQSFDYQNTGAATTYNLVIRLASGTVPGRIKYVNFGSNEYGDQTFTYATNSSTIVGHPAAEKAIAVAAAPADSQRTVEDFSSEGPTTYLFDPSGNRLSTSFVRATPDLTAIDGVSTTFFYGSNGYNGYPMFYGTSAAAPHAAAVAALVKAAHPGWTPSQIYTDLKATADPTISPANVNYTGAGLIDAYRAVVGTAVPATPIVTDGFESGYLGQDWTTYTGNAGRIEVTSGNSPYAGSYQLVEDGIADAYTSAAILDEAVLNLNIPSSPVSEQLTFYEKKFSGSNGGSQTDYPMPATFTGHGNYDGVAISVDGTNWYSLVNLTGTASTTAYQMYTVNLSSIAAADGITLGNNTQIKFQHYDKESFTAPDGGVAFDNVSVTGSLTLSGPAFYLEIDPDLVHLDIWAATSNTGTLLASVLDSGLTKLQINGTGTVQSLTVDETNGVVNPNISYNGSGDASTNSLLVIGSTSGSDAFSLSPNASSQYSIVNFNNNSITSLDVGIYGFTPGTGIDSLSVTTLALTLYERPGVGITNEQFSSITIGNGDKVAVAAPVSQAARAVITTATLNIAAAGTAYTGTLDLNANDLAVTMGNLSTVTSEVASGYANGAWNGTGIDSSAAAGLSWLGTLLNTAQGTTPIYGLGAPSGLLYDGTSPGSSAVLVKYTYVGDANLDGAIDGSDYSRTDAGSISAGVMTGWMNGDFNYDGVIDGSDYTLLDNAFNMQGARLASQVAIAATPFINVASTAIVTAKTIAPFAFSAQLISATSATAVDTEKHRHLFDDLELSS